MKKILISSTILLSTFMFSKNEKLVDKKIFAYCAVNISFYIDDYFVGSHVESTDKPNLVACKL